MKIQLSDHFTYKKLFKFTLPSIVMMVFTSIYGVDGIWFSVVVAEFMAVVVTVIFMIIKRKKYNYC